MFLIQDQFDATTAYLVLVMILQVAFLDLDLCWITKTDCERFSSALTLLWHHAASNLLKSTYALTRYRLAISILFLWSSVSCCK